jgi:hypothetical protein
MEITWPAMSRIILLGVAMPLIGLPLLFFFKVLVL